MQERLSRRGLLRGTATVLGAALMARGTSARRGAPPFSPVRHAFGFRNWGARTQYFDAPPDSSPESVRRRIRTAWREQARTALGLDTAGFSGELLDAIALQLRLAVARRAGTNGHCYGMVLSAQQYFERPDSIPVDRPSASDIEVPTVPVEEPVAPVYDDIVRLQAAQFLRFRAWLGRRAMLHPDWVDLRAVLDDARAVIEASGTAALTLFDGSLFAHQVLAYAVHEDGDGVTVPIYDPNRSAEAYRGDTPALRFVDDGGSLSMEPYGRYTGVLFNRFDRIERATGRDVASPLDHLRVGRETVRASLFPLALVLVDTEAVTLVVVDPEGEVVGRLRGTHADPSVAEYAQVRSAYGAPPGTYRVSVLGHARTEYEVRAVAAGSEGAVVDASRTASIDAGEVHEYAVAVPEDGEGRLVRTDDGWFRSATVGGVGVVAGAAVGAAGYRVLDRRPSER